MTFLNTSENRTHNVTISVSSGTSYEYFVKCRDSVANENSASVGFTIESSTTTENETTTTAAAGGGGGGAARISEFEYEVVYADQDFPIEFVIDVEDLPVNYIYAQVNKVLEFVGIEILASAKETEKLGSKIVYKHFSIDIIDFTDEDIDEVEISFYIPIEWIEENNVGFSTIYLERYNEDDGSWDSLETYDDGSDDENFYFFAISPGFSYFAITGQTSDEIETEQAAPSFADFTEDIKEKAEEVAEKIDPIKKTLNIGIIIAIVLLALVLVGIIAYYELYKKKKDFAKKKKDEEIKIKEKEEEIKSDPKYKKVMKYISLMKKRGNSENKIKKALEKSGVSSTMIDFIFGVKEKIEEVKVEVKKINFYKKWWFIIIILSLIIAIAIYVHIQLLFYLAG